MSLRRISGVSNKSRSRQLNLTRAAHAAVEALEGRQMLSGTMDIVHAVLFEPKTPDADSDKVVMAGNIVGSTGFEVVRLTRAGAMDSSFSDNGHVSVQVDMVPVSMAEDVDGNIYIAGNTGITTNNQDFAVVKLTANGALDTSFGVSGVARVDFGPFDEVKKVIVQGLDTTSTADDRLVLAGTADQSQFALARLNLDGTPDTSNDATPDTSFGGNGKVTTSSGAGALTLNDVMADGDALIAGGYSTDSRGQKVFALARYTSDGSLAWTRIKAPSPDPDLAGTDSEVLSLVSYGERAVAIGSWGSSVIAMLQVDKSTGDNDAVYIDPGIAIDPVSLFPKFVWQTNLTTGASFGVAGIDADLLGTKGSIIVVGQWYGGSAPVPAAVRYDLSGTSIKRNPEYGGAAATDGVAVADMGDPTAARPEFMAQVLSGGRVLVGASAAFSSDPNFDAVLLLQNGQVEQTYSVGFPLETAPNQEPVVDVFDGPNTGLLQTPLLFSASYHDPDNTTPLTVTWAVDGQQVAGAQGSDSFAWTPTTLGNHTVSFTVTDDGGLTASASKTVTIVGPSAILDGGVLKITGDGTANTIDVLSNLDSYIVTIYGLAPQSFPAAMVNSLLISGGAGDDEIVIGAGVTAGAEIHGGDGNDHLTGGAGNDILLGENGNDTLNGRGGNDIFVGGEGSDTLSGGNGQDILIGGQGTDSIKGDNGSDLLIGGGTTYDEDVVKLEAIRAIWAGGGDVVSRTNALKGLISSGLEKDDAVDVLSGDNGKDWIITDMDAPAWTIS